MDKSIKTVDAIKTEETPTVREEVSEWLKNVKFKRKNFHGVDEADVWQKIDELTLLYEKILLEKRAQETPAPDSCKEGGDQK